MHRKSDAEPANIAQFYLTPSTQRTLQPSEERPSPCSPSSAKNQCVADICHPLKSRLQLNTPQFPSRTKRGLTFV